MLIIHEAGRFKLVPLFLWQFWQSSAAGSSPGYALRLYYSGAVLQERNPFVCYDSQTVMCATVSFRVLPTFGLGPLLCASSPRTVPVQKVWFSVKLLFIVSELLLLPLLLLHASLLCLTQWNVACPTLTYHHPVLIHAKEMCLQHVTLRVPFLVFFRRGEKKERS